MTVAGDVNADLIGYEFNASDSQWVVVGTSEVCGPNYVEIRELPHKTRASVRPAGLVRQHRDRTPERCACGQKVDADGEHDGGYGAWCG